MTINCSVIFCDDIRHEANGKIILIGAYPDDLVPGAIPMQINLAAWIRILGMTPGEQKLGISIGANGIRQHRLDVTAVVQSEMRSSHIYVGGIPIFIPDYGHISLTIDGINGTESYTAQLDVVPPPVPPAPQA